eukprot:TRINITY_DN196_c0_g1_i1.p1 TRINITY_DN196_c0_g1~~TRINITY_DN196_c0_g1_i1.p1  ORF type:complete len:173 (-),score=21.30 TRINITY_DN196_c0_g1_i1:294-812(-)
MFFHISLDRELHIHPKHCGPSLLPVLRSQLHSEVEGSCSGRFGYIITVTSIDHIGMGKIQEGTGQVVFPIKFRAIVFRPFKGEVLDAVVTQVNKMGFFAEAGPLQIFVSKHLIQSDMDYDPNSSPPSFVSADSSTRITKDDEIRVKIVGTRVDAQEIVSIGSIKEDYLGLIS